MVLIACVAFAAGVAYGTRAVRLAEEPAAPPKAPQPARERPVQKQTKQATIAPAEPAVIDVLTEANRLGCECPLPPPVDIDPAYLSPAVEAWIEDLAETCPAFRDRSSSLDCSEWPCLLSIEVLEKWKGQSKDLVGMLTCGSDGPSLIYKGEVGQPGAFSHLFSVRPKDQRDYGYREMIRASAMSPTEHIGEIIIP